MHEFALRALQPASPPLPRFRAALAGAVLLGVTLALCAMVLGWVLEPLLRGRSVKLAGDAVFRSRDWFHILFVALLWSPVFDTLVAQWLSISFVRRFSRSMAAAVIAGAAVFSLGHMYSGGGWEQGIMTAISGAVFSWRYVHGLDYGMPGAIALTAVVHASNNALLLCALALQG